VITIIYHRLIIVQERPSN